jgi:hypothetical protein
MIGAIAGDIIGSVGSITGLLMIWGDVSYKQSMDDKKVLDI